MSDFSKKVDEIGKQILTILSAKESLTYTELKDLCRITNTEDSGKFAFTLRKLVKQSKIEESKRHYDITGEGKTTLKGFTTQKEEEE